MKFLKSLILHKVIFYLFFFFKAETWRSGHGLMAMTIMTIKWTCNQHGCKFVPVIMGRNSCFCHPHSLLNLWMISNQMSAMQMAKLCKRICSCCSLCSPTPVKELWAASCQTLELFYMMHKKPLRVKDFHGRREYICVLALVLRQLGLVCILALAPRIVSPHHVHMYILLLLYTQVYVQVNNRGCIRAGCSALLRGHCSSGVRNGETKGVSPGVKRLDRKGTSEFFEIFFPSSWSCL